LSKRPATITEAKSNRAIAISEKNVLKIDCLQPLNHLLQSNLPDAPENGSNRLFISGVVTYSISK
jgi:hypothetical protein